MSQNDRMAGIHPMQARLSVIFSFLKKNVGYNQKLQNKYYSELIKPDDSTADKVISMLWNAVYSQSQPKIDKLASFWKKVHKSSANLDTLSGFIYSINGSKITNNVYHELFKCLSDCDGWGQKTAALFCKDIYKLHHDSALGKEYKFWEDAASASPNGDKLFLPVDSVIKTIFSEISSPDYNYNRFDQINDLLAVDCRYTNEEILIWDDLWFWGFITQKSSESKKRNIEWNENKYWGIKHSPKDKATVDKIESLAGKFIEIINNCKKG